MKKNLILEPYSKIWIYCTMNDVLSIVRKEEPSYEKYAIQNASHYVTFGDVSSWRDLSIQWDGDFEKQLYQYITSENIYDSKMNAENFVFILQEYIKQERYVYVLVDTYNWLENRMDYHVFHCEHYVMLTGFDTARECFYVITDTADGYGRNEVPYQKFRESIMFDSKSPLIREVKVEPGIQEFQFDEQMIVNYAKINIHNLAQLTYMRYWACEFHSYSYVFFNLTKFMERQKAGMELFQYLCNQSRMNQTQCEKLSKQASGIERKWKLIRSYFMKAYFAKKEPDFIYLNLLAGENMESEYDMWTEFLKYIEN